jgi:hypothetical protein
MPSSWASCPDGRPLCAGTPPSRPSLKFARGAGSATVLKRTPARPADADVAQLVEHHLAKVRVAGSNPVVRSEVPDAVPRADGPHGSSVPAAGSLGGSTYGGMAEWLRQGPAKPCTRVRFPLPPRAVSSVGERFPDTEEVTSSNLVPPTAIVQVTGQFPFRGAGRKSGGSQTGSQRSGGLGVLLTGKDGVHRGCARGDHGPELVPVDLLRDDRGLVADQVSDGLDADAVVAEDRHERVP